MRAVEQDTPPERKQPMHSLKPGALDLETFRAFTQQEQAVESHLCKAQDVAVDIGSLMSRDARGHATGRRVTPAVQALGAT